MLGAAMLARTGNIFNNDAYKELTKSAIQFSCTGQLPIGAWYYGEVSKNN
jgi:hypothetical protein